MESAFVEGKDSIFVIADLSEGHCQDCNAPSVIQMSKSPKCFPVDKEMASSRFPSGLAKACPLELLSAIRVGWI